MIQISHVARYIDFGGKILLSLHFRGGQQFYTGSRCPTSLIMERVLSSKTQFIETGVYLTRTITEA